MSTLANDPCEHGASAPVAGGDLEFAAAIREYRRVSEAHKETRWGCIGQMALGLILGILVEIWTDFSFLGLMLCFFLPVLVPVCYAILIHALFLEQPLNRVNTLIDDYVKAQMKWPADCPDFVKLTTRGLPHGSTCDIRIDLATGLSCFAERAYLDGVIEDSAKHRLAEAARVANEGVSEDRLRELLDLLGKVPPDGDLEVPWGGHDGMPFSLDVVRNGRKRSCRGNLAGLPAGSEGVPEVPVVQWLLTMSPTWKPNPQGVASCDSKGNMTIYQ